MKTILLIALVLMSFPLFAEECQEFFAPGDHDPGVAYPATYPCLKFEERDYPMMFGKSTVRLYHFTDGWSGNAVDINTLGVMSEAAADILDVLGKRSFSVPEDIRILFTNEISANGDLRRADSSLDGPKNVCHVRVFYNLAGDPVANIKSVLAHEIHHCFLGESWLKGRPAFKKPYIRWIVEGMAQHFKTVVYPTVNDEWAWTKHYDHKKSLYKNNPYSTNVFFQSWSNYGVDLFLQRMALSGIAEAKTEEEMAKILSTTTDIAKVFQNFMEEFYMQVIRDSGFGYLPVTPAKADIIMDLKAEKTLIEYKIEPFAATIMKLNTPPKGKYKFSIDTAYYNFGHRLSGKVRSAKGFTRFSPGNPIVVTVDCDESFRNIFLVLTNTDPDAGTTAPVVTVEYEPTGDDVECPCKTTNLPIDSCLKGEWEGDNVTYGEELYRQVNQGPYEAMTDIMISGQYFMAFDDEDAGRAWADNQTVDAIIPAAGFPMTYNQVTNYKMNFKFSQQATGRFCVDPKNFSGNAKLTIQGEESEVDIGGLINAVPGSLKVTEVTYRCEKKKLTLYYKIEGTDSYAEWVYFRK